MQKQVEREQKLETQRSTEETGDKKNTPSGTKIPIELEKISLPEAGMRYVDYLKDNNMLATKSEVDKEYEGYDPEPYDEE
jgi:hypothetical protein